MALTILQAPADHCWSKNIIPLKLQSSLPYGAYFDIVISVSEDFYTSGDWIELATQRLYIDDAGTCEIDMQTIFDASFTTYIKPDVTLPDLQQAYDKIALAKFEIAEFAADGTPDDTFSAEFDLYRGGVPKQMEKNGTTPEWFQDEAKWLTWKPKTTVVSKRQPEFLTIKLPVDNSVANLRVRFTVFFDTGNNYDYDIVFTLAGISAYDWYFVPVGFNIHDLGALEPGANALYYHVSAANDDTNALLAEGRTYVIDPIDRPYERFFFFANSLMGFDCLRTIGNSIPKPTYTDVDADVTAPVYFGDRTPPIQRLESMEEAIRTVNTGFKSKEEADWLRDFRSSLYTFELDTTDMETLIPIILTKKEILPGKDNQDLYALQFDYKIAYDNESYSAIPVR